MQNRVMTDEELNECTRGVMDRFRASIEHSPTERADYLACVAVRLLYEVRRVRDSAAAPKAPCASATRRDAVPRRLRVAR